MPRAKNAKIWNEDLIEALRARAEQCRQQGKARQFMWREAADKIESVREDIYTFSTGRIVGLPRLKHKTVDDFCRAFIMGTANLYPDGYVPTQSAATNGRNPYLDDPYLQKIKSRGGAEAILLALYISPRDVLTIEEICTAAQPFCDEQSKLIVEVTCAFTVLIVPPLFLSHTVTPNFHQGRMYAGWSSNTTLKKHGLIVQAGGGARWNQDAGGFRSVKSSYSLTNNGRQFVEALLQMRPQLRTMIERTHPQANLEATLGGAARAPPAAPVRPGVVRSPTRTVGTNSRSDEQELRQWVETAHVGRQKVFQVGKQRRKHLHGVCDDLNQTLRGVGLRLKHESLGDRTRSLYITVQEADSYDDTGATGYASMPVQASMESGVSLISPPLTSSSASPKRRDYDFARTLGGDDGTPTKRSRTVPASVAAANAALERQAIRESKLAAATKRGLTPIKLDYRSSQNHVSPIDLLDPPDVLFDDHKVPPTAARRELKWDAPDRKEAPIVDLVGDDDYKKPAARPVESSSNYLNGRTSVKSETAVVDLLDSDDESDRKMPARATVSSKGSSILDDSDDDFIPPPCGLSLSRPKPAPMPAPPLTLSDLKILIDSRERNRNATPRFMRMELAKMLTNGELSTMWPRDARGEAAVAEECLAIGDFAFVTKDTAGSDLRLPVYIERKCIGDLVQRSFKKDHWKQLHRMRDVEGRSLFLLEGDFRNTTRYTAFGSLQTEDYTRNNHTIDDEPSLIRFIGRALLSVKSLRFIQTKELMGTLRAVFAVGLVSAASMGSQKPISVPIPCVTVERTNLLNRLVSGGVPYNIAACIADEIGSTKQMDALYSKLDDDSLRDNLLFPIVEDVCREMESETSPSAWSAAVHKVYFSALSDPSKGKATFDDLKHLVEDEAALLSHLHSGIPSEEALDKVLGSTDVAAESPRTVHITIPASLKGVFPDDVSQEGSFYRLSFVRNPTGIPYITIRTCSRSHGSNRLYLFVMEGSDFVSRLSASLKAMGDNYLVVARAVAREIVGDCMPIHEDDTRILLIRGLQAAFDAAAKKPTYDLQTRPVAELILAELMINCDTVVRC